MSLAQDPRAMAELDLGVAPDGAPGSHRDAAPAAVRRPRRARSGLIHGLLSNAKAVTGLIILAVFTLVALLAPVIAPGDPTLIQGLGAQPPSAEHWFGTTAKGQDVFALNVWGSRSSLFVGFVVGIASTFVGLLVGLASAYFGRAVDNLLSLVTNVFLLLPGLPLLVILAAFLPQGLGTVIIVLVITGWAGSARVLRSQALSIRGKDFVAAAQVTGERGVRIMFREILPNMASIVMSTLLACVIFGIGAQAGLEFLGLGDISTISWGTNLYWASNDGALLTGAWWVFIPPGVCIALVAFALALVNYGVDETTNPRLRRPRRRTSPDEPTPVAASVTGAAGATETRKGARR
jgi:peptide/nickel transport system permease protein